MKTSRASKPSWGAHADKPSWGTHADKPSWGAYGAESPQARAGQRACDHPGCDQVGEHRAPRSRDHLNDYFWFCLDHVRAYNASWDFYKGMSPDEIEAEIRQSTTWDRPTWPMGTKTGHKRFSFSIEDPFDVFADHPEADPRQRPRPPTPEEEAMQVLGLTEMPSLVTLKARYKVLVKRHHPDANGGDKDAEERFKRIGQAYKTLLDFLSD